MATVSEPANALRPLRLAGWLAVFVAVAVLLLRLAAFQSTGSLAVLADTLDPVINLIAAAATLIGVTAARRPADTERPFGYRKLEYVTVGFQGAFVLAGAAVVGYAAWWQTARHAAVQPTGAAMVLFALSIVLNLTLAIHQDRIGRAHRSPALAAAAGHARLDVLLGVAVLANLWLVGWLRLVWLDLVLSLCMAVVIVWQAVVLLRRSAMGLLDTALPEVRARATRALEARLGPRLIGYHDVRCRDAGGHSFVDFHLQFADGIGLEEAHDLAESVEQSVEEAVGHGEATAHLETAAQCRADREHVPPTVGPRQTARLRAARISLAVAVVLLLVKMGAAALTGSAAVLSDALESVVNVAAAVFAVFSVRLARSGSDDEHPFGHHKVEFLAAGFEGALVGLAGAAILATAVPRLIAGGHVENLESGLALLLLATVVNAVLGAYLLRSGRRLRSLTLEADGRHVLTDVASSLGVLAGLGVVRLTGWQAADPLVAIALALGILCTGARLGWRALQGLLDSTDPERLTIAERVLAGEVAGGGILGWHALRLRDAGGRCFLEVHVQLPEGTTLAGAHDRSEQIAAALEDALDPAEAILHAEPAGDLRRERRYHGGARTVPAS